MLTNVLYLVAIHALCVKTLSLMTVDKDGGINGMFAATTPF